MPLSTTSAATHPHSYPNPAQPNPTPPQPPPQVENNARRTFGPILDRAAKADRIRAVAGLLQRFDALFAAPARVMELAGRGELDQVGWRAGGWEGG